MNKEELMQKIKDAKTMDEINELRSQMEALEVETRKAELEKKLSDDGHEIYIITARSYTTENTQRGLKMRKTVIEWLKKHEIVYDKIVFSSYNKLENCRKNKIDIMIEDSERNINQLSEELTTICFDTRYNQNVAGKNVIRCYSWYDIYDKIKNIQKMA